MAVASPLLIKVLFPKLLLVNEVRMLGMFLTEIMQKSKIVTSSRTRLVPRSRCARTCTESCHEKSASSFCLRIAEDQNGHACMLRKKEEKRLGESTGAIKKVRIVPTSPEKSSFQCLDCGISTTSCFLLETHLNTEEHWERVKQVQLK